MTDDGRFARELAQEIVALTDKNQPERRRKIDWVSIILCAIACAGLVWAIFTYCFKAELAPYDKKMALIEQSQNNLSEKLKSGFEQLNKRFDKVIGVTQAQNDLMEENTTIE